LNRLGCDTKLTQALGRDLPSKREVEAAIVVLVLPLAKFLSELGRVSQDHAPVEFVFVGPMTALDFSIRLGAAPRNLPMGNPEVPQVPGEVGAKLGSMVRLDALDSHRQAPTHFFDERGGRLDGVVSVGSEHTIPGGLVIAVNW
jgi:hypothetical protein